MITITCSDTLYTYNIYHIAKAFFPEAEIRQTVDDGQELLVKLVLDRGSCFSVGNDAAAGCADREEKKKLVTNLAYAWLSAYTGRKLAWGVLTGVRPTKLAMGRLESGDNVKEAAAYMQENYKVRPDKALLAAGIADRERQLLAPLDYRDGFSLYVGIPFCPSICSYCSFGSSPAELWRGRMEEYLDALFQELRAIGSMTRGKRPDTIYIGGGTPVTLEAGQLERLLSLIDGLWEGHPLEYTVEAGRPDCITREKLEVIKSHSVTRISVNPQTMQQKTLDLIGRQHSVQETTDSFYLARELGFENINMDLIAGLPGERAADMEDTLRQVEKLRPDSLTIHSLAIKRAARMGRERYPAGGAVQGDEISRMVEDGAAFAGRMGLLPYYLYRQKNIAGNFENVGYAKVDKAGIYNILIMEEKQTILAAGAGTMTKLVLPEKVCLDNGKEMDLLRIENVKDVAEYISRIDEMIGRKRKGESIWH